MMILAGSKRNAEASDTEKAVRAAVEDGVTAENAEAEAVNEDGRTMEAKEALRAW